MKYFALVFANTQRLVWMRDEFWYGQYEEAPTPKHSIFSEHEVNCFLNNKNFLKPILEGRLQIAEIEIKISKIHSLKEVTVHVEKKYVLE